MNNIYNILAKHFLKETTVEEENLIEKFKQENAVEYKMLKKIWKTEGKNIKVKDFNTEQALRKIKKLVNKKESKVIPLYTIMRRVAAAVLILFSVSSISYLIFNNTINSTITIAQNSTTVKAQKVVLDDGTVVWLNKNAQITYPKKFSDNERVITLNGEAFFEVAKDKNRPFRVQMETTEVTVLGTSFNIKQDSSKTNVTVKTGKVGVKATGSNTSVTLTPGQSALVENDAVISYTTENKNYLAWKTGVFEFTNSPLVAVIESLNTYYKNAFYIDKQNIEYGCNITTKLNKQTIQETIEMLELVCDVHIIKENNKYKIINN